MSHSARDDGARHPVEGAVGTIVRTPLGPVAVEVAHERIVRVYPVRRETPYAPSRHPLLREASVLLERYFRGERVAFDLPLAPAGTTFARRVYEVLTRVGYGERITYGALAREAGSPGGARAVGGAVGRNPILLLIPCHRVVAANGIGGFHYGLAWKRYLLDLESPKNGS